MKLNNFIKRSRAVSLVEYAVLFGVISITALAVINNIGFEVTNLFGQTTNSMNKAAIGTTEDNGGSSGGGSGVTDTIAPTILSATSPTTAGTLNQNDPITVNITYDESVIVTGTPLITATIGLRDISLLYVSGSGSSTLTFTHNVEAGDEATNGDFITAGMITLNGGTIADAASNAADLDFTPITILSAFSIACVPPSGMVTFTAINVTHIWQVPCGITSIAIEAWGPGAAGSGGGGGGGGGGGSLSGGHVGHTGSLPATSGDTDIDNLNAFSPNILAQNGKKPTDGGHGGRHGTLGYHSCQQGGGGNGGLGGKSLSGQGPGGTAGTAGTHGICGGSGGTGGFGGIGGIGVMGASSVLSPGFFAGSGGNGGIGGNGNSGGDGPPPDDMGGGGGGGGGGGTAGAAGEYEYYPFGDVQGGVDPFDRIRIEIGISAAGASGGAGGAGGNPGGQTGFAGGAGTAGTSGAVIIAY